MRIIQLCFVILLGCSLTGPLALTSFGIGKSTLGGVTARAKDVPLNYHTFLQGTFQGQYEKRFPRGLTIYAPLVKSDNQLSFWLFKQISSNPKSKVVLGNNGHLIERAYLPSFNRQRIAKHKRLAALANQLVKLNEEISKRHKSLIILISTNKPSFYPELVPEWFRIKGALEKPSGGDIFLELLRSKGLHPFDTKEYLRGVEEEVHIPLFAPTGTHWNQYASCRISAELVKRIGLQLAKEVPALNCAIKGERKQPVDRDMDLLRVANLLFPEALIRPAPLVAATVSRSPDATRPKVLFVGTSFSGELLDVMSRNPALADSELWYYFQRRISSRSGKSSRLDRDHFDVLGAIQSRDAIILEVNEAFVQRIGYGFIDRALAALEPHG